MHVDAHCHVDRFPDPVRLLRAAQDADVVTVAVTELPSAYQRLELLLRGAKHIRLALGLHPLRAGKISALELRLLARLLPQAAWIGEVGLDFSRAGVHTRTRQVELFEHLLALPGIETKRLTVHSRSAEHETIARLAASRVRAVLHWYTGPLGALDDALAAGMFFSVNPAMLTSPNGRRILAAIPVARVLTETDGPYTNVSKRPAEPRDIPWLVERLASVWDLEPDQAAAQIAANWTTFNETPPTPAARARQDAAADARTPTLFEAAAPAVHRSPPGSGDIGQV